MRLSRRPSSAADPAASPLFPPLPHSMKSRIASARGDIELRQFVGSTTRSKDRDRRNALEEAFGDRAGALRELAADIRGHTLDHLDVYLDRFIDRAVEAGCHVHPVEDAAQANRIITDLARARGVRRCVKSKSMVTEEIRLVPALEAAGVTTVETDLGEFIVQLDHDAPSHIVTPMIHKNRASVARAFERELGAVYTEDPAALTMIAREQLRTAFRDADMGITGANFLVAETGSVVLCTNEGNGRYCAARPPVQVVVAGIEKVVPDLTRLAVLLKLLSRSSTGQPLTVYTSFLTGPRREGEADGPRELHIVLLDGGRTRMLESDSREMLRCIRCGACLNACPVYRHAGGHAYGSVYSGPIGAIITPRLKGLHNYAELPAASSLCGACSEACPVRIDIPHHLLKLRGEAVASGLSEPSERWLMQLWVRLLRSRLRYELGQHGMRLLLHGRRGRSVAGRFIPRLPVSPLSGWTQERDLPAPARRSFRQWWKQRRSPQLNRQEHSG